MKPAPFQYHRARDVEGATALLAELSDEAKVIAGGQSLVAMMNFRLARPAHLVDIAGLRELDHLGVESDGGLRIGALTTHHTVETAPADRLGAGFAVIRDAMRWIGHLPIRTRGTVGGSIAHADSTAEWCLLAVLLDAEFVAQSPRGRRRLPAGEFFFGYYTTALEPDEILLEIVFPAPRRTRRSPSSPSVAETSPSSPPRSIWQPTARTSAAAGWLWAVSPRCRCVCPRRRPCWRPAARSGTARRRLPPPWTRRVTQAEAATTASTSSAL
ncbi:hypothetical protein SVIO_017830 [Streptomyces violaceusniger]|uniref:FAD-binding PCMH-type domain-containing protein n=1 Tax=Streptomyces violaceusniger TaxID=68280 RepID=A0A4D4KX55_STRVO|nr:hypothetical protein SVIO_017830 [Streptomyces violaceusniger]